MREVVPLRSEWNTPQPEGTEKESATFQITRGEVRKRKKGFLTPIKELRRQAESPLNYRERLKRRLEAALNRNRKKAEDVKRLLTQTGRKSGRIKQDKRIRRRKSRRLKGFPIRIRRMSEVIITFLMFIRSKLDALNRLSKSRISKSTQGGRLIRILYKLPTLGRRSYSDDVLISHLK